MFDKLHIITREKIRENLTAALEPDFQVEEGNPSVMASGILFTDVFAGRGCLDEVLPSDRDSLQHHLRKVLEDYNSYAKRPLSIVLFDYAVVHLLRICRVLKMPHGHAFLIGMEGTGRQSVSRLAASLCDQSMVDIGTAQNYTEEQWREDLRKTLVGAGQDGKYCVLLLPDSKIKGSYMLDDINNLLNSGDVPNLFPADDRMQI